MAGKGPGVLLRSQRYLFDRQRAFVERFGLCVMALFVVEQRQVVEEGGDDRMLGPELPLAEPDSLLTERQRLYVSARV